MKKIVLVVFIVILIFMFGNFLFFYKLPDLSQSYKHSKYFSLDQVPQRLKDIVLQIEDKRFYQHFGIDLLALARAVYVDIKNFSFKQGASTIDQQVIKLANQSYKDRDFLTKAKEILGAINLNFHYSKDEIFLWWLNNVDFAYGVKGFKSACNIYFQRDCGKLWDSELLFLIAMYQTGKDPFNKKDFQIIKKRSKTLAKTIGLDIKNWHKLPPQSLKDLSFAVKNDVLLNSLPGYVKSRLDIDSSLSQYIEIILSKTIQFRQNQGFKDCCVIVMDKNGKIKSMNVCRKPFSEDESWINTCLIKRQTGSAIKPFVYLLAMNQLGYTGGTILEDKPIKFLLSQYQFYAPKNFDLKYHGKVSLAQALGSSLNIPAVYTLHKLGVKNFIDFINKLRIFLNDNIKQIEKDRKKYSASKLGLSAALGTYEMSPFEFVNLWRIFLYDKDLEFSGGISIRKDSINQIVDILSDNKNRLLTFDIDSFINTPGWALKTGTSRNFVDGWVCGVNKENQLVMCVWVGNVNNASMKGPGSQTAGFLWYLITKYYKRGNGK